MNVKPNAQAVKHCSNIWLGGISWVFTTESLTLQSDWIHTIEQSLLPLPQPELEN